MSRAQGEPRLATHLVRTLSSDLWHYAANIPRGQITCCNGRFVAVGVRQSLDQYDATCRACTKALDNGRIRLATELQSDATRASAGTSVPLGATLPGSDHHSKGDRP